MNVPQSMPHRVRPPRSPRDWRCAKCERLLAQMDHSGLKAGAKVEIKCGRCNHLNVRIGDDVSRPAH